MAKIQDNTDTFDSLLKLVKADELKKFVSDYALGNQVFKSELENYINGIYATGTAKKKSPKAVDYDRKIEQAFQHETGDRYHSCTDWNAVFEDLEKILDDADLLLITGNEETALDIAEQFFLSLNVNCDDSLYYYDDYYDYEPGFSGCDYSPDDFCERAEGIIMSALESPSISKGRKQALVESLQELASEWEMDEYCSFDFEEMVIKVSLKATSLEDAINFIDGKIKSCEVYEKSGFVIKKIRLLEDNNRSDDVEKVFKKYIALPSVRELKCKKLMEAKFYDEAIALLRDGIVSDKIINPHRVDDWYKTLLQIYEIKGDTAQQTEICRHLFVSTGGSNLYYQKLRKLVPQNEWNVFLPELIAATNFQNQELLADIYVAENDSEKLYNLIIKTSYNKLDMLDKYSHNLKAGYSGELLDLYVDLLKNYASKNLGRDHYVRIKVSMECMCNLDGGKGVVAKLADFFRITYKNRRAMKEILNKF